jgi:hypothetical protein
VPTHPSAPLGGRHGNELDDLAENKERLLELCAMRAVDLGDSRSLDELAYTLYSRFSTIFRGELLVDRERNGTLADEY